MAHRKNKKKGTDDIRGTPSTSAAEPRVTPGSNDSDLGFVDDVHLLGTNLSSVVGHSSSDEGSKTSSVHIVSNSMF
jgi:hypothetical protein